MTAIGDLVRQTSVSTGTGNFTLVAPTTGYQTFATVFSTGATTNVFYYYISNTTAIEWELGTGHMSASTTLVRDTIILSSNANAAVSFSAGTKFVVNDIPASLQTLLITATNANTASTLVKRDSSGNFTAGTITAALSGNATTATTAAAWTTARLLNGVSVSGSANADPMYPGTICQEVIATFSTATAVTALIPNDNTIPQNTEGTQIITASITPRFATSKIRVRLTTQYSLANLQAIFAIFIDSGANAVDAVINYNGVGVGHQEMVHMVFESVPGSGAHTYAIRAGCGITGTITFNSNSSGAVFGGVCNTKLILEEITQ